MIQNYITQEEILKGEPHLDSYLKSSELSYSNIVDEAFNEFLSDIKNQRYDLKKLGVKLSLQTSVTKSAAYSGDWSTEDFVERRRLIVNVTSTDGNAIFKIEGSNDDDYATTYTIKDDIQFTKNGENTFLINDVYKFYRFSLVSISTGNITYTADLYETTFDYPMLFLIRSKIYHSLYVSNNNDAFKEKSDTYYSKYMDRITNGYYPYDLDQSGTIEEDESNQIGNTVTFTP